MGVVKKCFNLIKLDQLYGKNDIPERNVISYLRQWNPRLQMDSYGNLYLINPGTPILNAHMDTVQDKSDTKQCAKRLKIKRDVISAKNCIIGGDDKCGIAIAMQLYEELGDKISLLFTRQEEVGCVGIKEFVKNETYLNLLKQAPYVLTLDRRGSGDIIGEKNSYCSKEFEDRIYEITKPFGYKPEHGLCSDANTISDYVNVVNLSVGYYNPHTNKEYIECKELINAMEAVRCIVETIKPTEKYEIATKYTYKGNGYTPGMYDYGSMYRGSLFDYDDDFYYSKKKNDNNYFGKSDSKDSSTQQVTQEEMKDNIKELLSFFSYDSKSGILTVKKNVEVGGIAGDSIEDVFDIPKGTYYMYEYVDDLDKDMEAIKQTYGA